MSATKILLLKFYFCSSDSIRPTTTLAGKKIIKGALGPHHHSTHCRGTRSVRATVGSARAAARFALWTRRPASPVWRRRRRERWNGRAHVSVESTPWRRMSSRRCEGGGRALPSDPRCSLPDLVLRWREPWRPPVRVGRYDTVASGRGGCVPPTGSDVLLTRSGAGEEGGSCGHHPRAL